MAVYEKSCGDNNVAGCDQHRSDHDAHRGGSAHVDGFVSGPGEISGAVGLYPVRVLDARGGKHREPSGPPQNHHDPDAARRRRGNHGDIVADPGVS